MKRKVLVYSIMILFTSVLSLNALYISEEQFKKAESECLSNIAGVKKSVKKFPVGKIIKISEADNYYLFGGANTGNHYFLKCDPSNRYFKLCFYSIGVDEPEYKIEYQGETYFYVESQLSDSLRAIDGECYEILQFDKSGPADHYYVSDIPKNAILEYDVKNKTLKVLPQNEKLVKELLEIVKKKKSNKK
ncbi:MAG: hypothetical protein J5594_05605 [Elusimicrobiaceae bacterium]|nr:hypothetical protein [Elusimicrobiaceae bacterium]